MSSSGTSTPLRRPSQNDRILELLADGRWHTTRQILAHVPCIVHSRIAEINGRGTHTIEHRGGGAGAENHEYRLNATSDEANGSAAPLVSSGVSETTAYEQPSSLARADGDAETPHLYEQLELVA